MTEIRKLDIFCLTVSLIFFGFFCYAFPTTGLYSTINVLVGITCLSLLFLSGRNSYDLRQVFYLANFVFLVLAARMEKSLGVLYWGSPLSVLDSYEIVGVLCFLAIILFYISYGYGSRLKFREAKKHNFSSRIEKIYGYPLILLSVLASLVIYQNNGWNIASVFFRGGDGDSRVISSQTTWLLYQMFLYPIPSICLVVYFLHGRRSTVTFVILLSLVLLANPPTGMARWQAAMLYGAIFITGLPNIFKTRLLLSLVQFLGLFLLFPLLDSFRRYSEDVRISFSSDWIFQGHLDAAQNVARVVDMGVVTHGSQLLGALFFFVPRAVWPSKPVGSGHYVAGLSDLSLSNISMHFFGEGYVNFGYFGIFIFSIFLGVFFGMLDRRAWSKGFESSSVRYVYPFMLGWVFFLMRGDLTSSFAYMVGTAFSVLFVCVVSIFFNRLRVSPRQIV